MGFKVGGTTIVDNSGNIAATVGNIDGRDIAADGTKLDGIETSATADQTDAEIKTAYENNSDTNALTDALLTKLNGIEASADVTDTANVVASLTAGTNVAIAGNGTISSTDTNTTYSAGSGLDLSGTTFSHTDTSSQSSSNNSGRTYIQDITLDTYGHVTGIATATETVTNTDTNTTYSAGNGLGLSGTQFYMTGSYSGNFTATGNVTAYSDESLKDNIVTIENPLDKINAIRGVTYNRNDMESNPRHTGVIAQEVEKVLPEVVSTDDAGLKSVAYGNMVGLLIEAIKELSGKLEALENDSTK